MDTDVKPGIALRETVPAWLGNPPDVRIVEAHASLLCFADAQVFTIKKALELGYFNATIPEERGPA